ncbi:hypothetical protein OFC37_25700, partial [Escherichia coli]|nr:hypothetical protein [Escherichia coli]
MKRLLRRGLLLFLALVIALQAPFIYRRYEIGQLEKRIEELGRERKENAAAGYREVKGIIHAHTSLGGHSTGRFDELI